MRAALVLVAVVLYGGCSATPTDVVTPAQSGDSDVTSSDAEGTAPEISITVTKTGSKSSPQGSAENEGLGGNEIKDSAGHKGSKVQGLGNFGLRGSIGFKGQGLGGFGGRGSLGFGELEAEGDYLGKNFPYGAYDTDGEYEEQDDGFSNQESANYDIDINGQTNENARGDLGGLSAALLLAHHAKLAHLLYSRLSHHSYVPEIIGLHFLTRGVPGGAMLNLLPLQHLTAHKLKELMYLNALSKSLPNLMKSNLLGRAKALGLQSAGIQLSNKN